VKSYPHCCRTNWTATVVLILFGLLIASMLPELRRYLRIASM